MDLEDLKKMLAEQKGAFDVFKAGLGRRLDALEAGEKRRALGLGGGERGDGVPGEVRAAFEHFARTGEFERKAMAINSGPDGGFSVPSELDVKILSVAATMGAIRRLARNVKASSADFTSVIATSFSGTAWLNETATRSNTATPSLATVKPSSGGLSAVAPVSNWLLNDSQYDVSSFVIENIGQGMGIAESAAFISGSGVSRPTGILSTPLAITADATRPFGTIEQVNSGTSGTFDIDDLVDLLYKLAPQYRARAAFVMAPSAIAAARKLKASTSGDYYWQPAAAAGQPPTMLGVPVYEDVNLPAPGAASNSVLCGDFLSGYTVTDIGNPILIRDPLTSKGNTLFYVERRIGGAVTDSNAIKVLSLQ